MRGFIDRLKKGRIALAALGLATALGGTIAAMPAAQAYDRGDHSRDRDWRHDRWEREHWRQEQREREWRRWHYDRDRPVYYAPPAYYVPPRAGYYYGEPNVSFGFNIR